MNPNFSRPNLAIQWTLSLLNATSFAHTAFLDLTKIHHENFSKNLQYLIVNLRLIKNLHGNMRKILYYPTENLILTKNRYEIMSKICVKYLCCKFVFNVSRIELWDQ